MMHIKFGNVVKKKSTDFSTWLSYKGCTKGLHSNEKPPDADMPKVLNVQETDPENQEKIITWNGLNKPAERSKTFEDKSFFLLPIEVGVNAQKALTREMEFQRSKNKFDGNQELIANIGTTCKNNTCKEVFDGSKQMISIEDCLHHPGYAVFHEGMKYWSCCQHKTSDFGTFLDQRGCVTGRHCWNKPKEHAERVREDWFQRGGLVHINIYCKSSLPSQCCFEADRLNLRGHITYEYGNKETDIDYELFGEIIPDQSHVIINERKIEIVLKQDGPGNWPKLRYEGGDGASIDDNDGCFVVGE